MSNEVFVTRIQHMDIFKQDNWDFNVVFNRKPSIEEVIQLIKEKKNFGEITKQFVYEDTDKKLHMKFVSIDEDDEKLEFYILCQKNQIVELS